SRDKVPVATRRDPDSLDATNRARRADGDFPVVWAKQYGKGRVFNVGWGHPDTTWDDPRFQQMMLEGIKWAMGITKADVTPRPFPGKPASPPQDGGLPEGTGERGGFEDLRRGPPGGASRVNARQREGLEGCDRVDDRSRRDRQRRRVQ